MNILVVDDNPVVREGLADQLIELDYQVSLAENGLSALNLAQQMTFDFIITDYKMPFMDGIKLSENLIKNVDYKPDQLLILTTDTSLSVQFRIKQLNINWLAKPIDASALVNIVNAAHPSEAA